MSAGSDGSASERPIARIVLAAERDYLAAALAFLREVAARLGLGEADVASLARATEEVCLNVIEHGFESGQPASFDLVLLRRPGQLVLAVENQGLPFDWSRIESGSPVASPSLTAGTDAVRFVNLGTQGNRAEIVKHLPFDHIDTYMAGGGAAPLSVSTEMSTAAVTVRSMTLTTPSGWHAARIPSTATACPTSISISPIACARCCRAVCSRSASGRRPRARS